MKKNLEAVTTSYEDLRKEQKRKRDAKEAGEEAEPTKVRKAFNKKLNMEDPS